MIEEFELETTEKGSVSTFTATPCGPTNHTGQAPTALYNLPGPQVEYEAAFWLKSSQLRPPTIQEIEQNFNKMYGPIPAYSQDKAFLDREIFELKQLESQRTQPLSSTYLSDFINLQLPPFGAIFNTTGKQVGVKYIKSQHLRISNLAKTLITTGQELARMFEIETPGLLHRQAVNWLLFRRGDVSPIRQARIWLALDLAIYSALSAAWHFKWAEDKKISFRQRPWEYDPTLTVLFDKEVDDYGTGNGSLRGCPCPSPGTPRHPAFPSGHSTYSAAASAILKYFFYWQDVDPSKQKELDYIKEQLDLLSNNIGEARLWAGVHWRTDHTFGQMLGNAVAESIIDQLKQDCVPAIEPFKTCASQSAMMPPSDADLQQAEAARANVPCANPGNHDRIPTRSEVEKIGGSTSKLF